MEDKITLSKNFYENLNFENFSNLLLQMKIITTNLSNEQKVCINYPKIDTEKKKDLELSLSDNDRDNLKNEIKTKICSYKINFNELYDLFPERFYERENFNTMIQVFILIFNNFNDDIFKFDLNNEIYSFQNKIQLIKFSDNENKKSYEIEIKNLYEKIENMNEEYDIQIKNIYFLVNIFTLFGKLIYKDFSLDSILINLNEYSSIIINDIKITLFIHFHIITLFNLTWKKLSFDSFLDKSKKEKKSYLNFPNEFYPTVYFLNSNLKNEEFTNTKAQLILIGNTFKFYLYPYIISNLKIAINIKVFSYNSFDWIFSYLKFNADLPNNIYNLEKDNLFDHNQFNSLLNHFFYIKSFSIDLSPNVNQKDLEDLFKKYNNLIISSIYFSADSLKFEDKITEYPLIRYFEEIKLLNWVLKYNLKLKNNKKKKDKQLAKYYDFSFSFNSFSIATKKDVSSKDQKEHLRDILIFLHNYHYSEIDLLLCLAQTEKLEMYYNLLLDIIKQFSNFKKYSIGIRLSGSDIKDSELKYYLYIVYLKIQNYLKEHNQIYKNVVFYEEKMISDNFAIILMNYLKIKEQKIYFENSLKKLNQQKIYLLYQYYKELHEYFSETLIVDQTKNFTKFDPYIILNNFNNNKCIIVYNKYEVMDLYVYVNEKANEDLLKLDNITQLMLKLTESDFIREITLIMNYEGIIKSNYWNNNKKLFCDKVKIYILNNKNINCLFDKKHIILSYYGEKINNKYELFCKMVCTYFEQIKYITSIKKLKYYDNLVIIYKNKIYEYKEASFRIKKISKQIEHKIVINEVLKGDNSFPLFIFISGKEIKNINLEYILFNFENIIYKTQNFSEENFIKFLKNSIEKSLEFYYPLVTNEKYLKYLDIFFTKHFLEKELFENEVIFPLNLVKITNNLNPIISKKITTFEIPFTKLNFFTINDVGKIFGFKKIHLSLEELLNISKIKESDNNKVDIYETKFEDFANIVRKYKKKVKFIGFSENNQGKAGYPKRKKQNQKCEIF